MEINKTIVSGRSGLGLGPSSETRALKMTFTIAPNDQFLYPFQGPYNRKPRARGLRQPQLAGGVYFSLPKRRNRHAFIPAPLFKVFKEDHLYQLHSQGTRPERLFLGFLKEDCFLFLKNNFSEIFIFTILFFLLA